MVVGLILILSRAGLISQPDGMSLGKFVTGSHLMGMDPEDVQRKWGFHLVHQSWKNHRPEGSSARFFATWGALHPNALHVLWTDAEDVQLISRFYPELQPLYEQLPLYNQRFDLVRLLYLHRYGGLYCDLDYEAKQDFFSSIRHETNADLFVVQSPVLLNEVMQNSLMFSKIQRHEFFLDVISSIGLISDCVHRPNPPPSPCGSVWLFRNPFTATLANIVSSVMISGPAVLDKTVCYC
jgi:hypothetical protein